MKKTTNFFLLALIAIFAISITGCGYSSDKISEKEILNQFNQKLHSQAVDINCIPITIGIFDCQSNSDRLILRQMAAADLITYNVTRYAWWERSFENVREAYQVEKRFWYYTYTDTEYRTVKKENYNFEDHYVVSVELARKGKNLVVENLPTPIEEVDKDLLNPEIDPSKYTWNKVNLDEEWPYIPNPFIESKQEKKNNKEPKKTTAEKSDKSEKKKNDDTKIDRIDSLQYEKFNKVTTSTEYVYLKAYEQKGIKARKIQTYEIDGIHHARAEVIISTMNVTDVARILLGIENDMRTLAEVNFVFYQDKGWVMTDADVIDHEDI